MRIDAQPGGQPDAPIHRFYLASVGAARRLPYPLGAMNCVTVSINGTTACVAGAQDALLLSASVSGYVRGESPATLDVSGMREFPDGRNAHVYWCENLPLVPGDVVRVTFCQAKTASEPTHTKFTDTAEYAEEQRAFAEFEKSAIFPPEPMPVRFAALAIALSLNNCAIAQAKTTSDEEHILGTALWVRRHPDRCRVYVRSFGGFLSGDDRETTEWYRGVLSNNDTFEFRIGA